MKRKETAITGIVARSIDYKDNDKLLTVVTTTGTVSVIIKGVRSEQAKLKLACSLFSLVDYSCMECAGGLYQATTAAVLRQHYAVWTDIKRYSAASVLTEAVAKVSSEGNDTSEELELLKNLLEIVDESDINPLVVAAYGLNLLFSLEGVDYEEFAIPLRERELLTALNNAKPTELDALDSTEPLLLALLGTMGRIYHYAFSAKLNSVYETIKTFSL